MSGDIFCSPNTLPSKAWFPMALVKLLILLLFKVRAFMCSKLCMSICLPVFAYDCLSLSLFFFWHILDHDSDHVYFSAHYTGLGGNPAGHNTIAYNTSKGAVLNYTRSLAAEWGKYNINVNRYGYLVNLVCPILYILPVEHHMSSFPILSFDVIFLFNNYFSCLWFRLLT